MTRFDDFLEARIDVGATSTEDVLASFLPLVRQVVAAHQRGMVAPLEGLDALQVEGVRTWYEEAHDQAPSNNRKQVERIEKPQSRAVEIVNESKRTTDVDDGRIEWSSLDIGMPGEEIARPVFLPGYVSWEQDLQHHDPLTDVFSLGMILASLSCLLDFREDHDLELFAEHRRNLFRLNPELHPVVAKAVLRMTDLRRHKRAQDLEAILRNLENYRSQEVDLGLDLAQERDFGKKDLPGKRQLILQKLQERLFEVSRRNRLLHFRQTMHTVNLTHASVPLSFDVRGIRPDQILTWNVDFQSDVLAGRPIPLNKYLNFREALYLPSVLDRVRAETRRDRAEFGFSQLRLVLCFLRWANLKEKSPERYDSPFLLLPVELVKKKGIQDTYWLKPVGTEAEVNPVLRYYLKELYDIALPETIDLQETSVGDLFDAFSKTVRASEAAVHLTKVDQPRIDLVHDRARRRLDQYRRRVRIGGRGIRTWGDIDYSYDTDNFHPLGLQLFRQRVLPPSTELGQILRDSPPPRRFATSQESGKVREKENLFFSVREEMDDNPFNWELDLCSVTLGNFKYRKMSLVRDYLSLQENEPENPAFDAIFSLVPGTLEQARSEAVPLEERFQVVPSDPTQSDAIGLARAGASYIIQGPPGTGKSQTITNLIADFVARGKRVLFVCEKRAAIDVVYHRLEQQKLHQLCTLIHDALTDKKEFVMDLKRTYESFRADASRGRGSQEAKRNEIQQAMTRELRPLERFHHAMEAEPEKAGVPLRELFQRAVALSEFLPELPAVEREALPSFAEWHENRERITRLTSILEDIGDGSVLARHPLGLLSPSVAKRERPLEHVSSAVSRALRLLDSIENGIDEAALTVEPGSLESLSELLSYASKVADLAKRELLALLDRDSALSSKFDEDCEELGEAKRALEHAVEENVHWGDRLTREEAELALEQARAFEGSLVRFLSPGWWQLRSVLRSRYDFGAHAIKPPWSHLLRKLKTEYEADAAYSAIRQKTQKHYGLDIDTLEFAEQLELLRKETSGLSDVVDTLHGSLLRGDTEAEVIVTLAETRPELERLALTLDGVLSDYERLSLRDLQTRLNAIEGAIDALPDFVHCLSELEALPASVSSAFRRLELEPHRIEAAVSDRAIEDAYRVDRSVSRFDGNVRAHHVRKLEKMDTELLEANAAVVRERVRNRFLEHFKIASLPAAQLTSEQKKFKSLYNRGRRELEHEFGKTMRYKSIRELVSGESGQVVRDLKPVWLMSPLSVSDTLALDADTFDVVIFDEASQVTLEEAVPSVARAHQVIVVGDEMQLPPTNFFSAKREDDEDKVFVEEDGELHEYDLESNSFLNHASKNLPSKMLGWHYRSRSESLISFSNWAFYHGNLLTVPERRLALTEREEIRASRSDDAAAGLDELLSRPVSFHFMTHGVYERRRNRAEADYIARLVHELLMRDEEDRRPSVGVVAFSEAQQTAIEDALERLALSDRTFRDRLETEREREEEGQFVGLLVKNLENIQGDERDIIIMSVCYGYGPEGRMLMNFGPINQSGGEKRLNVAFSRAKEHMALVSSVQYTDIKNDYNDGASCLKNYLRYASACSMGRVEAAQSVLSDMVLWRDEETRVAGDSRHPVIEQLAAILVAQGFVVERDVGQSHFRCDLAVRHKDARSHELGIFVDHDGYYRHTDILERDVLRPKLMSAFGWRVTHVLTKDWYAQRERVLERVARLLAGEDVMEGIDEKMDPDAVELEHSAEETDEVAPEPTPSAEIGTKAADPDATTWTRYFELIDGSSSKFWEVTFAGAQYSVRFGRIGTEGQERAKTFANGPVAEEQALRILSIKVAKGYRERDPSKRDGT